MNKKPYAYLDGIPDKSSDLYNDAGYLNESEVQAEIGDYLDIDDATAGQVLTMGESGFPEWDDVASGGGYQLVANTEVDTGNKWVDGRPIYVKAITNISNNWGANWSPITVASGLSSNGFPIFGMGIDTYSNTDYTFPVTPRVNQYLTDYQIQVTNDTGKTIGRPIVIIYYVK